MGQFNSTSHYFSQRDELSRKAKAHTLEMNMKYPNEISASIQDTRVYSDAFNIARGSRVEMIVERADSVSAVLAHATEGNIVAVANFASYKYPGGMFFQGSKAQEECLCHESTLYNVISKMNEYYEWNNQNKNKALYTNRALYSKNIVFERDENKVFCDVITCAAPNYKAAYTYQRVSAEVNAKALRSRINFIKNVLEKEGVEVFIFGAFGCGVFGQNPEEVARICKEEFAKSSTIKKVYFSIIDEKTTNVFRKVIG